MTEENNREEEFFVLTDEDGNESKFEMLDNLEVDEKEYIVLLPEDQLDNEEAEVVILEVIVQGEEDMEFQPVVDDATLQKVFEEFQVRFQQAQDQYEDEEEDF